jgi:hypothetical protein
MGKSILSADALEKIKDPTVQKWFIPNIRKGF